MSRVLNRQEKKERTRERLIDAAAKVFARRGYHDAGLGEIAAEGGYSTGAVYSNFSGKEGLFLALADRKVEEAIADIRAVADAAERGERPVDEAVTQFRAFAERDGDWPLLFFEFWSFEIRNPRIREEFRGRRQAVRDALADTLERVASDLGFELRFPAPALATALSAAVNGMAFERAADPDAIPDDVFGEFISAVLACSVAAPTNAARDGSGRATS
jgi:AcrR family transcriptional regulator